MVMRPHAQYGLSGSIGTHHPSWTFSPHYCVAIIFLSYIIYLHLMFLFHDIPLLHYNNLIYFRLHIFSPLRHCATIELDYWGELPYFTTSYLTHSLHYLVVLCLVSTGNISDVVPQLSLTTEFSVSYLQLNLVSLTGYEPWLPVFLLCCKTTYSPYTYSNMSTTTSLPTCSQATSQSSMFQVPTLQSLKFSSLALSNQRACGAIWMVLPHDLLLPLPLELPLHRLPLQLSPQLLLPLDNNLPMQQPQLPPPQQCQEILMKRNGTRTKLLPLTSWLSIFLTQPLSALRGWILLPRCGQRLFMSTPRKVPVPRWTYAPDFWRWSVPKGVMYMNGLSSFALIGRNWLKLMLTLRWRTILQPSSPHCLDTSPVLHQTYWHPLGCSCPPKPSTLMLSLVLSTRGTNKGALVAPIPSHWLLTDGTMTRHWLWPQVLPTAHHTGETLTAVDITALWTVTEAVHKVAAGHLSLVDAGCVAPPSTFVATVQTTTTIKITLTMQPKLL